MSNHLVMDSDGAYCGDDSGGVRTLPVAFSIALASVLSPLVVHRVGTKIVVAGGLTSMTMGFLWVSTASASTPYLEIVGQMILLGAGLGATTAPATESIMGSLSLDKAGIGSAVNDTTRELGGTFGVTVVGSALPPDAQALTRDSVAAAGRVAPQLGPQAGAPVSTSSRPTADNGRPRVGPFNATNIRSVVASNGRSEFRYIANVVKIVADIGTQPLIAALAIGDECPPLTEAEILESQPADLTASQPGERSPASGSNPASHFSRLSPIRRIQSALSAFRV